VSGVESATVVGPRGEEIHCDEFGRVRVHFHWDRESKMDDNSSCWIHVSHPWGGAGYGGMNLPRVGQEVLVDFLGGDPDRPIIVGRVYTNLQKVPYKLPDDKTQSGWKSNSTNNTGGYNEIMFEDASGKELLRMQAERDLNKLVKRNENITVGNSRAKAIGVDEAITVGNNRTKSVGQVNSTSAGVMHSVTIAPPGQGGAPPPTPTTVFTMIDKNIALTTGNATIQLLDKDIILAAKGSITLTALEGIKLTTQGQINQVSVDNTTIDGKKVLINCAPPPAGAPPSTQLAAASTGGGGSGGTVGAVLGASFVGPTKG
jgi:type VI secretion system secreted protein VgrG